MDAELRKRIEQTYSQAASDMEQKFNQYMKDFARKDAAKRDLVSKGLMSDKDYVKWRKGQIMIGERWKEMRDVLAQDLTNTDKIATSIINGYLPEAYATGHNYGTFQIERGSCINTSYTLYSRETVERLIKNEPRLLPVTQWELNAPKDMRWNHQHVTQQITQGILQGESIPQIAKRLERVVGMDERAAMRNARTAITGAQNAGRIDAYRRAEKLGIGVEKEWLATMDNVTRDSHIDMDGEHVPLNDQFSNGMDYPGGSGPPEEVYNCRCTVIPRLTDQDYSKSDLDRWRDPDLGDMTYDEWKDSHAGRDVPEQEEMPRSFVEMLSNSKENAEDTFRNVFGQNGDVDFRGFNSQPNATEKAEAIERTISELQKTYPMQSANSLEYRSTFDKLTICDYSEVGWHLPKGDDDRRIDNGGGILGQVFSVSRDDNGNTAVIAFSRDSMFGTIDDVIKERGNAIASGKDIYVLGGYNPELTAVHEWGHVMSEHIATAMIHDDPIAHEYWDWYKSLSREEKIKGISHYAAENRAEFEAECFTEMQMPNPRPLAVKYWSYMEKILEKGF